MRISDWSSDVCSSDLWQVCRFILPSTVLIDSGVALVGTGGFAGDRAEGVTGYVINLITPATERSCYYFLVQARDFARDADAAPQARFNATMRALVQEDIRSEERGVGKEGGGKGRT